MKVTEITALALRLLGIYLFLRAITALAAFALNYTSLQHSYADAPGLLFLGLIDGAVFLLAAGVLIKCPNALARCLVPNSPEPTSSGIDKDVDRGIDYQKTPLEISGFILIGIYILASAIPDLSTHLTRLITLNTLAPQFSLQRAESYTGLGVSLIEMALAFYLLLGHRGLYQLILRLRR